MKEILKDVISMTESDFIKKYTGVNIKNTDLIINDYGFFIPTSAFLQNMELDKTLMFIYYSEKLYNGNDNCHDAYDFLHEYMNFNDSDNYIVSSDDGPINTYNYESNLEDILQYTLVYDNNTDNYYLALEVHLGGDVRGNYSHILFFKWTDDIDYFFTVQEYCYIYIENCDFIIDVHGSESSIYNPETYEDVSYFNTYELQEIIICLVENNIKVTGYIFEY